MLRIRDKMTVDDQVRGQVWEQVDNQVVDQVRNQVFDQVWYQVWDKVRDQVRDQVWDQMWDKVGDQVMEEFMYGKKNMSRVSSTTWTKNSNM